MENSVCKFSQVLKVWNSTNLEENNGKVLKLNKIFMNKSRTLGVVTAEESDEFVLVNLDDFEVIQRNRLGKELFNIMGIAFNPFFEMNNSELKDHVKAKMEH
mmetsp:Transcript_95084/g.205278  ORF Transcript_95084/g.205278 Transcript_95084/m.205278 type:complete len:102 (+) Transcript_95084:691-996(+)